MSRLLKLSYGSLVALLCGVSFSACQSRFDPKSSTGKKTEGTEQPAADDSGTETDAAAADGTVDETAATDVDGNDSTDNSDTDGDDTTETVEDTTPPANIVLANQPPVISNSLSYSFSLSGAGVTNYSYQIIDSLSACPGISPTTAFPLSTNLSGSLDSEGSYRLCIWGRSLSGIAQLAPTEYVWTADATAPVAAVDTTGAKILANAVGGEFVVSGSAGDLTLTALDVSIKQDASSNNCLNTGKSAFDAVCPNFIAVTPDVAWTFPIPISAMTDGSSYEVTLKATDGAARVTNAMNTFTWSAVVTVFAGVQTSGATNSYLQKISFNPATNAVADAGTINLSAFISAQLVRGIASLPDGRMIVGDGGSAKSALVELNETVVNGPVFTGATPELTDYHGLCVLPNGSYIVGRYGFGSKVNQYAADGTFVAQVYVTTVNSLTACHAFSNTEVVLVDYDANNDNNGDLVRLQFDGTNWAETSRWDQSASGLPVNSSIYSIAVLSNGDIFALPQNGGGTRNKKMIKCPAGVLANCAAVGSDVISAADGFSQGLAVIPGTNDLLIGTGSRLLRFNTGDNTSIDLLFDISALPSLSQLRHLIIR